MEEENALIRQILLQLSKTRYSCSSLTRLDGGTANFLYRGTLLQPIGLHDGTTMTEIGTVVVKHYKDFVPGNNDFSLDITRCVFEASMLHALASFSNTTNGTYTVVRTPRLYLFHRESSTQVLENCYHTTDLKTTLVTPSLVNILPGTSAASIGHSLGFWLRSFHMWTSAPSQASLRATIRQNMEMQKLKHSITYDSFLRILQIYPQLVEDHMEALKSAKDKITAELELVGSPTIEDDDWGLIHGDFWTGNVLVPNMPWKESRQQGQKPDKLYIIDWENAQFGHRAIDIGGMLADLYERKHFKSIDAVIPIMRGFTDGYGRVSDEMAFRTAIHAGVHLICWHIRRNPEQPLPAPQDQVVSALTIGRDLVLKGWEKDREWLAGSVLAPLFTAR